MGLRKWRGCHCPYRSFIAHSAALIGLFHHIPAIVKSRMSPTMASLLVGRTVSLLMFAIERLGIFKASVALIGESTINRWFFDRFNVIKIIWRFCQHKNIFMSFGTSILHAFGHWI